MVRDQTPNVLLPRIVLNLALRGGGAHGAFTWGVLDRLLDGPEIASINGLMVDIGSRYLAPYAQPGRRSARA